MGWQQVYLLLLGYVLAFLPMPVVIYGLPITSISCTYPTWASCPFLLRPWWEPVLVFSGTMPIPAQVFMGDTGSLTLGGIIAALAIMVRKELLIPIFCGVFLVENLSVMIQVSYFKYTKRKNMEKAEGYF